MTKRMKRNRFYTYCVSVFSKGTVMNYLDCLSDFSPVSGVDLMTIKQNRAIHYTKSFVISRFSPQQIFAVSVKCVVNLFRKSIELLPFLA